MTDIVKIQNFEGDVDEFIFPYNPQSYQESNQSSLEMSEVPYSNFHIAVLNRSLKPKSLSFSGHFSDINKDTQYEEISRRLGSGKILKIFFRDSRFHIVVSPQFQKTNPNNRTNFLDYVFSCIGIIPISFGSVEKISYYNKSSNLWTNGYEKNEGGRYSYIHEVEMQFNGTSTANQTIIIDSDEESGITLNLGSNVYSSGETLILKMVELVTTGGISQTKFWRCTDSTGNVIARRKSTNKNELGLSIEKDARIDSYTISGTAPIGDMSFKFRDGFSGG